MPRCATFDGLFFLTPRTLTLLPLLPCSCNPSGPQDIGVPHAAQVFDFVSGNLIELLLVRCLTTLTSRIKTFRNTAVVVAGSKSEGILLRLPTQGY